MKRVVATVVLGGALVVAGITAGHAGTNSAFGHGILLVGRAKHGTWQVFLWRPGSGVKSLGRARYPLYGGAWSPDWRSIAYPVEVPNGQGILPTTAEIKVMRSDGTQVKVLAWDDDGGTDGIPNWSPNGRRLVYERDLTEDPWQDIAIVDFPSGHERSLSAGTYLNLATSDPVWGKPGIAYVNYLGIMLLDPATGQSRLLKYLAFRWTEADALMWSPRGILTLIDRRRIVLLSAAGHVLDRIPTPAGTEIGCMRWSPDGKQILMTAKRNAGVWVRTMGTKHWQRLSVPVDHVGCVLGWR